MRPDQRPGASDCDFSIQSTVHKVNLDLLTLYIVDGITTATQHCQYAQIGFVLRPPLLAHKEVSASPMKVFNIAVVGCGNVSRMHFAAYTAHPERIRIVAVCDPVPERVEAAQRAYGVAHGFSSSAEMVAHPGWDIAVVCTPTAVREEAVGTLVAAGKHVFAEKPLADHYAEAQRIVVACEQAGVQLAVNQNFRYHYPFEAARRLIAEGRIGNVVSIAHQELVFRQDAGWRLEQERHALSVMGVHWFDGFRWMLADDARSLTCETRSSPAITSKGETDAAVQIVFERGAFVAYAQSFSAPVQKIETVVIGERGALVLTYDDMTLYDKEHQGEPIERWENPYRGEHKPEATFTDLDLLFTALENGTEPPNSGRDNLKTVALLDSAYRSAAERQPVQFRAGVPV